MKKAIAMLLALLLVAMMLPVTAMAATVEVSTYDAMKDALATSGAYVKLTGNIDTSSTLPTEAYNLVNAADNCTLDLNGYTFTANNFAVIFEGTNLTIKNGKFNSNGGSYALFVGDEGGSKNVVVEDIETTGGINIYNASVTLRNVTSNGTDYYSVWCDYGSSVIIESGEYSSAGSAILGMQYSDDPADKVDLTVKGGRFYFAEGQPLVLPSTVNDVYGTPSITGGTFYTTSQDQIDKIKEFIPADSELTPVGDGFTVTPTSSSVTVTLPAEENGEQKNPSTGAYVLVGAAVAVVGVSVLDLAAIS